MDADGFGGISDQLSEGVDLWAAEFDTLADGCIIGQRVEEGIGHVTDVDRLEAAVGAGQWKEQRDLS